MDEYAIYEYVKDAYRKLKKTFDSPITSDLLVYLVGQFGLDILLKTKLIAPVNAYRDEYKLCCETE